MLSMPPNSRVENVDAIDNCGPIIYQYKQIVDLNHPCPVDDCGKGPCKGLDSTCHGMENCGRMDKCGNTCGTDQCGFDPCRGGDDRMNPCDAQIAPTCYRTW